MSAWDRLNQFKGEHLTVVKCRVNSDVTQARKLCLKRSSVMKHIANQKHIKLKTVIAKTNKKRPDLVVFTHTYFEQIHLTKLVTTQNCTRMLRNVTFVVQIAYFCTRPNKRREKRKKVFLFLNNFRNKKQLLTFFGATFGQRFEKSRATFWEISSNLWKALLMEWA